MVKDDPSMHLNGVTGLDFSGRCAMFGLLEDFVQKRREACKMDGLQGVSSL